MDSRPNNAYDSRAAGLWPMAVFLIRSGMMRMTKSLGAAGCVIALLAGAAIADPQSDYESLFGQEAKKVQATADTKDDANLAAKVLTAAKMATDAPKSQVYFYQKAYELGIRDAGGHATAIEALNLLEKAVPEKRLQWQSKRLMILEAVYQRARGAARRAAAEKYLEILLRLADAAAAAGKSKEAWELYRRAHPVAAYVRSPQVAVIAKKIKQTSESAAAAVKRQGTLKSLMGKLAADPRDMKARTELILFCVAELDEPGKAVSLLTKGVDEKLTARVMLASKKIEDVPAGACLELGNWYYETLVAKVSPVGKVALLRRAATYYRRHLALSTERDVKRLNASLALEEIKKELDKLGVSEPAIAVTVHWNMANAADVYLNGKPLREYKPDFRRRRDEAYRVFSAKVKLRKGDVFTVGGSRGGSYGLVLFALDAEGKTVWKTDAKNWQVYAPADPARWFLPKVAAASKKGPVTVKSTPWGVGAKLRAKYKSDAASIWSTPLARYCFMVSTVK